MTITEQMKTTLSSYYIISNHHIVVQVRLSVWCLCVRMIIIDIGRYVLPLWHGDAHFDHIQVNSYVKVIGQSSR